jgi:hypothetical protein
MTYNRSREGGDITGLGVAHYYNGTYSSTYSNYLNKDIRWKMQGENIPDFHKRSRAGELLPQTHFENFSVDGVVDLLDWHSTHKNNGNANTYVGVGFPESSWTITSEQLKAKMDGLNNELYVQKAAAQIYNQSFDALTFIAEFHKTARMFMNIMNNVRKLLKLAANDPKVKDAASLWLEYRYGWRILFFEIQQMQQTLESVAEGRIRYAEKAYGGQVLTEEVITPWSNPYAAGTDTTTYEYKIQQRGSVVADYKQPDFLFNPITTGWELVRFSFIIDWVVDIGGWLQSLSFLTLQSKYTASYGTMVTCVKRFERNAAYYGNWVGPYNCQASSLGKLTERVPTRVSLDPQVNLNLSPFKMLDIDALVALAFNPPKHLRI